MVDLEEYIIILRKQPFCLLKDSIPSFEKPMEYIRRRTPDGVLAILEHSGDAVPRTGKWIVGGGRDAKSTGAFNFVICLLLYRAPSEGVTKD